MVSVPAGFYSNQIKYKVQNTAARILTTNYL